MEKGTQPGLYLGPNKKDVIHQISGPVSMYYLRPKPSGKAFGIRGVRPDLPLIMLWGDRHRENEGMCPTCACASKNCCHLIYDKPFLTKLDKMGKEHPIDFYTEYSKEMMEIAKGTTNRNVLFSDFLEKTTARCHQKELRSQPGNSGCPTTLIRWHYADIRFMKNTLEYNTYYYLLHRIDHLAKKLSTPILSSSSSLSAKEEYRAQWYRTITGTIVELFHGIGDATSTHPLLYEKGDALQLKMLKIITTPFSEYNGSTKEEKVVAKYKTFFSLWVNEISQPNVSVFYKQLKQMGISQLTDTEWLVTFLTNYYVQTFYGETSVRIKGLRYDSDEEIIHTNHMYAQLIYHMFDSSYTLKYNHTFDIPFWKAKIQELDPDPSKHDAFIKILTTIRSIVRNLESIWVDLYMVARMLKPPKGNSPPLLVFGYFGNQHVIQLVHLLTSTAYFDYDIIYEQKRKNNNTNSQFRCLTLTKPIRLYQDLIAHAAQLQNYRTQKGYIKAYQNVIEAERRGRGQKPDSVTPPSLHRFSVKQNKNNPSTLVIRYLPSTGGERTRKTRETRKTRKTRKRHMVHYA